MFLKCSSGKVVNLNYVMKYEVRHESCGVKFDTLDLYLSDGTKEWYIKKHHLDTTWKQALTFLKCS